MRRIISVLAVALVMAVMLVVMAAPAIAYHGGPGPTHRPCPPGYHVQNVLFAPGGVLISYDCVRVGQPI
jgi:hypothetical protein